MMDAIKKKANAFEAWKSEVWAKICSHQLFSNKFRGWRERERGGSLNYSMCKKIYFGILKYNIRGRVSSVGIATRYGLDGPWIESQWGRDFPHPYRPALGPTQPTIQWVPGLYWG